MWFSRVPIIWLDFGGNPVSGPDVPCHPFLDIEVAVNRQGAETDWLPVRALVDTGASFTLLSPKILDALDAKPAGTKELSGNFATVTAEHYSLCIRAVEARHFTLCAAVCPLEIDIEGADCHAVLGMDYLRAGRLTIEVPPGESHFEISELRLRAQLAAGHSPAN